MPTVIETIEAPDGVPLANTDVTVRLIASTSGEAAGYVSANDITVLGIWKVQTGADGVASLTLIANSLINPANTVYEWTRKAPGRPPVSDYISVPNGSGPYVVEDILTDAPTALDVGAIGGHVAAPDPHPGYQKESEKGQVGGYASLDGAGTVPDAQIPASITRDAELSAAVTAATDALIAGAPGALDTLNELAAALGDDANFAATVATSLATRPPALLYDDLLAAYPARPSGDVVIYVGPVQPVDWTDDDIWIDKSEPLALGDTWHREAFTATLTQSTTVTLGASPIARSERVWKNGVIQEAGVDYLIDDEVITISLTASDRLLIQWAHLTATTPGVTTVDQPALILRHTFTAADAPGTVPVSDVGLFAATPLLGTWGISSNQLYISSSTSNDFLVWDVLTSDCTVQVKLSAVGGSGGLFVRSGAVGASPAQSNGFQSTLTALFRRQSGSNTQVLAYSQTFVAGDTMRIVMAGSSITVYRDAGTTGSFTSVGSTTQTFNQTATKHGVRASTTATSFRFDDFEVRV